MSAEPDRIVWRVHPAAERRGVAAAVFGMVLVLSVLAAFWMEGVYWGLFAFAVLFLSLEAFFLPCRFELTEEGVVVRKPFASVSRPWGHFRRVIFDRVGVTLSPFGRRHWLESYRAIRLRFKTGKAAGGEPTRQQVRDYVLAHIDAQQVGVEGLDFDRDEQDGQGHRENNGSRGEGLGSTGGDVG